MNRLVLKTFFALSTSASVTLTHSRILCGNEWGEEVVSVHWHVLQLTTRSEG